MVFFISKCVFLTKAALRLRGDFGYKSVAQSIIFARQVAVSRTAVRRVAALETIYASVVRRFVRVLRTSDNNASYKTIAVRTTRRGVNRRKDLRHAEKSPRAMCE